LRTDLDEQLSTTFNGYQRTEKLADILGASSKERVLYIDQHIPDLVAVPYGHDFSRTEAYLHGYIILQDKASCFPAYLLDPSTCSGDIIDTCAAPGNKTTHLAALVHTSQSKSKTPRNILAFERNPQRSHVLKKMVSRAGGDDIITAFGSKDFLTVDPNDSQFARVEALLLDPSCSGTGIVGRDDEPKIHLPGITAAVEAQRTSKKRKRPEAKQHALSIPADAADEHDLADKGQLLEERLRTLSAFQLQLIERAMQFPRAARITYSTCSVHAEENETVVMRALASKAARKRGWRILRREEQPDGLQIWAVRGIEAACESHTDNFLGTSPSEVADACIRCEKGTNEGTMGFFVAAFTRSRGKIAVDDDAAARQAAVDHEYDGTDEWRGFSDGDVD
jgi:putative methyltransferase